ncbi:helix-turn-helix domain-containing protein [Cytobacillus firmus]|uniref:helix-turn-helix domain-containing protein n=1 Tax=Cytobacillus firmus TaxID=1399 RepID=UPI0036B5DADF
MNERKEQNQKELFLKLALGFIESPTFAELEGNLYKTLIAIASHQNDEGLCYPSQDRIAKLCGTSRETVNRRIKKLIAFRTKEGHALIEKETVRQRRDKTRSYYRILPASGLFFGKNKVVTVESHAPESEGKSNVKDASHSEKTSEVVTPTSQGVVTNLTEGSDATVTRTRAINNSHLNNIQLEQEPYKKGKPFVANKKEIKDSSKDNNNIEIEKFVAKEKESKDLAKVTKETQSHIVEKKETKEGDKGKSETAAGRGADGMAQPEPKGKKSLTPSDIVRLMKEESEKKRKHEEAKAKEERRKKSRDELLIVERLNGNEDAGISMRTPERAHTASESPSKGKVPETTKKANAGESDALGSLSFEQLVSMSDEEIQKLLAQ